MKNDRKGCHVAFSPQGVIRSECDRYTSLEDNVLYQNFCDLGLVTCCGISEYDLSCA